MREHLSKFCRQTDWFMDTDGGGYVDAVEKIIEGVQEHHYVMSWSDLHPIKSPSMVILTRGTNSLHLN